MFKKRYYLKIWQQIGYIVNLSQFIEYNLANILALNEILSAFDKTNSMYLFEFNELAEKANKWYEKLEKMNLGKVLSNFNKKDIFTDEFIKEIDEVREERNYFVHRFFKEDLKTKEYQNNPKQFIPRLRKLCGKMYEINSFLCEVFDDMKKEYKLIY